MIKVMKKAAEANYILITGVLNPADKGGWTSFCLKQNKLLDSHVKIKLSVPSASQLHAEVSQ